MVAEADTITAPTATGSDPLLERLLARGFEFDFFQAVWLLERYGAIDVPVGGRGPVGQESFRFRPDISVGFPPTDLRRVTQYPDLTGDRSNYLFEVTFLGLYGVSTPLPLHYAIDLLRSVYQANVAPDPREAAPADAAHPADPGTRSTPTRDFLDVFHHRLISLFYRSWLKYRYNRSFGLPGRDVITDYLVWLIGYAPDSDKATLGVSPIQLLRYAGSLTQRPRSAIMLKGMLLDYWENLSVKVEQCVGRWVPVPPADRNCIGLANCGLGFDLTVGEQVYDLTGSFATTLGPMDWTTYVSFLPGGPRNAETCALVQRFCADPLTFTIELRLRAGEVPEMVLSSGEEGSRLGFTSWVRTEEMPETSVTFRAAG
jgi:type VI secretion system protein ImpH